MTSERLPGFTPAKGTAAGASPQSGHSGQRNVRWRLGGLLILDLGLLLLVLSFAHMTAEGPAKRSLGQGIAILTEVDAFLDAHLEALREEAAERDAGDEIELPDFPISVSFTAEEVLGADREGFRALLLSRSTDLVYEDGMSVFEEDSSTGVNFFSSQGLIRRGMDFLREGPHNALTALTWALAAVAAALTLGLALACRGYGRLVALGTSVSLAALPFLLLAVAARFALRLAADGLDEYLAREFLELVRELTWAPIRNGIILSIGGLLFLALGTALARWSDRRQPL